MVKEKTTTTATTNTTAAKAEVEDEAQPKETEVILATPGTRLLQAQAEPGQAVRIEKDDGTIITTFM